MITKLLNEVNEKIETLNNLVQDKEYFVKLDERIEKINNYAQEQQQEVERLHSIIKEVKQDIEVIEQLEDIEVIKMQLRNIIFRLKDSDKE